MGWSCLGNVTLFTSLLLLHRSYWPRMLGHVVFIVLRVWHVSSDVIQGMQVTRTLLGVAATDKAVRRHMTPCDDPERHEYRCNWQNSRSGCVWWFVIPCMPRYILVSLFLHDYAISRLPHSVLPSSELQRSAICVWTDVSEKHITSIFRVEYQPSKKPAGSGPLGRIVPDPDGDTFFRNVGPHADYKALYSVIFLSAFCTFRTLVFHPAFLRLPLSHRIIVDKR
jgi:hypothetical protein